MAGDRERERRERGGLSNFNFKYLRQVGRCPPGLFPFLIRVRGRRLTLLGRNPPEMRREIPSPPPSPIPSFYRRHCGGSRGENFPWQEEERSAMLPVLCPPPLSTSVHPPPAVSISVSLSLFFCCNVFLFPSPTAARGCPPLPHCRNEQRRWAKSLCTGVGVEGSKGPRDSDSGGAYVRTRRRQDLVGTHLLVPTLFQGGKKMAPPALDLAWLGFCYSTM